MTKFSLSLACALLVAVGSVQAGTSAPPTLVQSQERPQGFAKGALEFENVAGAFWYFDRGDNDGPSIDLAVDSLRLGRMLSDPHGSGFLAGNSEFLAEVFGGPIFQGPGDVTAGATLLLRYNFFRPGARVIPYMQVGAGGVYTDISRGKSHGLVSLPVEFNLQGSGGLRFVVNQQWSILVEAGYRHISNASIKLPNRGVDSVGGDLGFGFFF